MSEEFQNVRVTNTMMYQKLMDINENQIAMIVELKHLSLLPDRVRGVESRLDKLDWIEKIAYSALGGSIIGIVGLVLQATL
jgi:archaellum component FlaD/FlaE